MKFAAVLFSTALLGTTLLGLGLPAQAQETASPIYEVRAGFMAHDVPVVSFRRESGVNFNSEFIFHAPTGDTWAAIGAPRPHLGFSLNNKGNTSQAYGGVTWEWEAKNGWFFDAGLGGAVHNGYTTTTIPDRKELGSKILFRLSTEVGYRFDKHHGVSLLLDHISNGYTKSANEGLDTLGLRYSYRF